MSQSAVKIKELLNKTTLKLRVAVYRVVPKDHRRNSDGTFEVPVE